MFKKYTLPSGLRIILAPRKGSVATTVLVLVATGSEYETKRTNGLSHFLEHMCFKGTVKRPRPGMIAEELEGLGAENNAFTSQEYTGYWAKAESHKSEHILELVSDLYLNPIFVPAEIEKERGVIIEELNMYEDTPMRRVQSLFAELLYGDQPAGWDIGGTKEVIGKLKQKDFIAYRTKQYVAPKTVVVVAGDFNEKKMLGLVKAQFSGLRRAVVLRKPKTKIVQYSPRVITKFKESDQSHLVLGFHAFGLFDERRFALQVLATILGGGMSSRLFRKVREEMGAAYYVRAASDLYLDHGYFAVSAGVNNSKITPVTIAVLEELKRIAEKPVGAHELKKSKDFMVGNFIMGLETADELAGFYGDQEILTGKIRTPDHLISRINAVSAEDVRSLASLLFRDRGLNLAVIGPYHKKDEGKFKKILRTGR